MTPLRDVQLLLDTLRFAPGPDGTALTKRWADADAVAIVRLADFEGATLWLQRRANALDVVIPPDAAVALSTSARHAAALALRVDEAAYAAFAILDRAGIHAVPLKAAAVRRIAQRVPYADARATSDVDLLVAEASAQGAWRAFTAEGYVAPKATEPGGHHLAGLFGDIGVAIELHTSTSQRVSPGEAWRRATRDGATAMFGSVSRAIPNDTELLWHAVSHAMGKLGDARKAMRLRGWLDVAALCAASGPAIDWTRITERIDSGEAGPPRVARAWLDVGSTLGGYDMSMRCGLDLGGLVIDLERLLAWRLHVMRRHASHARWAEKLDEEGTRAELGMPLQPARATDSAGVRLRHLAACGAARACWLIRFPV